MNTTLLSASIGLAHEPPAVEKLWAWHHANALHRRPPEYLLDQAITQSRAQDKADTVLEGEAARLEAELNEFGGMMGSFSDNRDIEDKLADRLDDIGRHSDATKGRTCRRHATLATREKDSKLIPMFSQKCKHPRFCLDEARAEGARTARRDVPVVHQWKRGNHRRRLFFITLSPSLIAPGRLEWAARTLFEVFDEWRRSTDGKNIVGARATVESPLSKLGAWHPHLHALICVEGQFDFKKHRKTLNQRLRKRLPVVAGDVLRWPDTGRLLRVERLNPISDAIKEVSTKPKKLQCDIDADVAVLSDGSEMTVGEIREAIVSGACCWGYRLTGKRGKDCNIRQVTDDTDPMVEIEFKDSRTFSTISLSELNARVSRGELNWDPDAMSFQIDFKSVSTRPGELESTYKELVKYMLKFTGSKGDHNVRIPPKEPLASYGTWPEPPGLLELPDEALREWCEAGDGFRRSRAYGILHGIKIEKSKDKDKDISPLRVVGYAQYQSSLKDYSLYLNGGIYSARERALRRRRTVDLIHPNRSAVHKANKSADAKKTYRGNLKETGPPS